MSGRLDEAGYPWTAETASVREVPSFRPAPKGWAEAAAEKIKKIQGNFCIFVRIYTPEPPEPPVHRSDYYRRDRRGPWSTSSGPCAWRPVRPEPPTDRDSPPACLRSCASRCASSRESTG